MKALIKKYFLFGSTLSNFSIRFYYELNRIQRIKMNPKDIICYHSERNEQDFRLPILNFYVSLRDHITFKTVVIKESRKSVQI